MSKLSIDSIVTITPKSPPHVCGIGDYTINFATYCKSTINLNISLVVETTCASTIEPITIWPSVENWSASGLKDLFIQLEALNVKTVILQYTGFSYSPKGYNFKLISFWRQCASRFQTLIVVHETYNRWSLKYPGTWALNPLQKYLLRRLVKISHEVFCGSEVYLKQLKHLTSNPQKLHYLPIPSNIPPHPLTPNQRLTLKQQLKFSTNTPVLVLFGCQDSIRQDWLAKLDGHFKQRQNSVHWLLLGNAQKVAVHFLNPVLRPGYLSSTQLSHYLQMGDLLLMPHEFGISAKRTSLMVALEHGIPVVGTDAYLTDSCLRSLPSILLAPDGKYSKFEEQIDNALVQLSELQDATKIAQCYYQENFSWPAVTKALAPYCQPN
jgi:glycosyltransferase involved in cell wall biosynthesis